MTELQTSSPIGRDSVFVAGGQPSVTYVDRDHLKIEEALAQALKVPNQIVSIAGPTKCGKTVFCRHVLQGTPHLWIEGGQIETAHDIWERCCYILNYPIEIAKQAKDEAKIGWKTGFGDWLNIGGSLLRATEAKRTYRLDSMASAIRHLSENSFTLVLDDFHYLPPRGSKDFPAEYKRACFRWP